ncbi:uncharacterized protein GGS25DRAFT_480997 [Hypoxylon fragiforme]|uniref:uncharacterized protein n=1 Tax=Hypoxylon fragiforme TaxID=63214 RepID=UPI0020C5B4E8|nr:uncharacterized protein GGS25DRAFT_480997 [Hypoxylon fragiforme]KAI2611005.1 hypothetical protein GGS25DRAFT_480997 [Hypoxylon fragiforme]
MHVVHMYVGIFRCMYLLYNIYTTQHRRDEKKKRNGCVRSFVSPSLSKKNHIMFVLLFNAFFSFIHPMKPVKML